MKTNEDSFFAEPLDPHKEGRALALEVISRVLIWIAESATREERSVRATVALYCVRPDLLEEATLDEIGDNSGRSPQAVHKLAESFRTTTGLAP
jgi:hypothetical protein